MSDQKIDKQKKQQPTESSRLLKYRMIYEYDDSENVDFFMNQMAHNIIKDLNVEIFLFLVIGSENVITMYIQYTKKKQMSSLRTELNRFGIKNPKKLQIGRMNLQLIDLTHQMTKAALDDGQKMPFGYYRSDIADKIKYQLVNL
jgi:hypothetical protein